MAYFYPDSEIPSRVGNTVTDNATLALAWKRPLPSYCYCPTSPRNHVKSGLTHTLHFVCDPDVTYQYLEPVTHGTLQSEGGSSIVLRGPAAGADSFSRVEIDEKVGQESYCWTQHARVGDLFPTNFTTNVKNRGSRCKLHSWPSMRLMVRSAAQVIRSPHIRSSGAHSLRESGNNLLQTHHS